MLLTSQMASPARRSERRITSCARVCQNSPSPAVADHPQRSWWSMSTSELTATSSAHDRISPRVEGLPAAESPRAIRLGKRARLYTWVFVLVALLVVLVALIVAN